MRRFNNKDYKAAGEAFSAAAETAGGAAGDDCRVAFDRGCAYAAQGKYDKAAEQFQKSAAAADQKLAARSHYNRGDIAVSKAKNILGEKPEEAAGDARSNGLELLIEAARCYRDCLRIDPETPTPASISKPSGCG